LPINIEITDDQILVTAENGTRVALSRRTGTIIPPPASTGTPLKLHKPRAPRATAPDQIKVSPRWILRVGDFVLGQHKPRGRKFRARVKAIKVENGTTYVQVHDPRSGGCYLLGLDRITRLSAKVQRTLAS
jgi:hypothetical protein